MEYIFLFLIGIAVGSFLNVVIDRTDSDESIWKGRSHCDHCKKTLKWYELVPLFSFALQGGKSRCCHSPLSLQYPGIELLTSIIFVGIYLLGFRNIDMLYYIILSSCLIALFFIDVKYGLLPDKIVFFLVAATFLYVLLNNPSVLLYQILAGAFASLFFLFIFFITRGKGMGLGDVKLAFFMGLFLGFPSILVALYFAFLTGAFISIILILGGKKKLKGSTIAFGPFLIMGTIIGLFWTQEIINLFFQIAV